MTCDHHDKCTECHKVFIKKQYLDQHAAVDHGIGPCLALGYGPNMSVEYTCSWNGCNFIGKSGEALMDHIAVSGDHLSCDTAAWICKWQKCGHTIKGTKGIARKALKHISTHVYWLCTECYSTFKRTVDYERHECRVRTGNTLMEMLADAAAESNRQRGDNAAANLRGERMSGAHQNGHVQQGDISDDDELLSALGGGPRMIEWQ